MKHLEITAQFSLTKTKKELLISKRGDDIRLNLTHTHIVAVAEPRQVVIKIESMPVSMHLYLKTPDASTSADIVKRFTDFVGH